MKLYEFCIEVKCKKRRVGFRIQVKCEARILSQGPRNKWKAEEMFKTWMEGSGSYGGEGATEYFFKRVSPLPLRKEKY